MEYNFKICEPCIKGLNTRVILTNWENPPNKRISGGGIYLSGFCSDNVEYVIQWPWQWFYRWQIKRAKKKIIKRYHKWQHSIISLCGQVEWIEKTNSEEL